MVADRSVAIPNQEEALRSACAPLSNYFNIRNTRIKSTVAAEIVQVGASSERGNQKFDRVSRRQCSEEY